MNKVFLRATAKVMLLTLTYQIVFPLCASALTTGPSQPEVQSFEPVGTTEMVNMFTGDFTYNIPLMDVEGYPVNIAYHGGVGIEQEASWVGLGWNINPGEINRAMRGLPDDFNGENIEKTININEEVSWRVGMGGSVSFEAFGWDAKKYGINLSLGVGGYMEHNNYKGVSVGMNTSATVSVPFASTGVNMGIGSQTGADIDVNAGLHISKVVENDMGGGGAGLSVTGSTGFNSRTGMKALSFGVGINTIVKANAKYQNNPEKNSKQPLTHNIPGQSFGSSVPIGLQNYVPVVTNPGVVRSFEFQARFGGELFYTYPNVYMSIQKSTTHYETDGTKKGFGYLYAENAPNDAVMDYSRDNDGYYNNTLRNLPLSSMTYDLYSVSGHGTGGVFRPFRNDIGSVFDAEVKAPKGEMQSVLIEGGIGNLFELGTDLTFYDNEANSGPWQRLNFRGNQQGSLYEKVFFKQAGELTYNNQQGTSIYNNDPVYVKEDLNSLTGKGKSNKGSLPAKYGNANVYWTNNNIDRTSRSNLFSYLTAEEADIDEMAQYKQIPQFEKFGTSGASTSFYNPNQPTLVDRYSDKKSDLKSHHMSEITQTLGDGRRYVYGIPAVNHLTREASFSVTANGDVNSGLVNVSDQVYGSGMPGKEAFYSSTTTPAYAHSYLLTAVLSADYVDILGDGPTDDDLGSWVKFNYSLWSNDYRWRTPYASGTAQFMPGFQSDPDDDKGSVVMGSRQQWHVRSIESKNFVAEFYVGERHDGRGFTGKIVPASDTTTGMALNADNATGNKSYKLDSIKLFNKHSRYLDTTSAIPVKTVIFKYAAPGNSLCKGIPNTANPGTDGKLTLEKIYTRYGSSDKNLLNPYSFTYGNYDPNKHGYNYGNKDRWGNFKNSGDDLTVTNYEFPYVRQDGENLDADSAPYDLTEIKLPSGGVIEMKYESDDYSYVQDRRTMQMFKIHGVGKSNKVETKTTLYEDLNNVNDYIYFKRIREKENPNLSLKDNYLENAEYLYYSLNMDITGTGTYDFVKGYARVVAVDSCSDDGDYGYVQVKKDMTGGKNSVALHPATIYGINLARTYLPHKINKGYNAGGGFLNIINGLLQSAGELMKIRENPVLRYIESRKVGKNVNLEKSWVRLLRPGLTKKGGGTRVKELTLNDSWSSLSANENAVYGKSYDYTVQDDKYGIISSGVASYEPLIGGDENPFKLPVPYTSDAGRLLPKVESFQEEPFGESFFPPAVVGYSKIRVKSIHFDEGRSSKSIEEHQFYTAREFPVKVDYTEKDAPPPIKHKGLRKKTEEVKVYQGYVLQFNDMHGKPKNMSNYVVRTDGSDYMEEKVSSVTYNYRTNNQGELDNNVNAIYRKRGTTNEYALGTVKLGEEIDFTVDTRERYNRSYKRSIDINLNVVLFAIVPVPIPTSFFPDKEEVQTFRSMVSTKVIQRYGLLKSVETFDNGAKTTVENMVYDAETGDVLLTKTNNSYNDHTYDVKYPAYWAYERMGPAYTNIGYEATATSLVVDTTHTDNPSYHGLIFLDKGNFHPGDELLISYKKGSNSYKVKGWVLYQHPATAVTDNMPTPYVRPIYSPSDPVNISSHIRVALRASRDTNNNELWTGLNAGDTATEVVVKVIRSGRRNQLDKAVQNITMVQDPAASGLSGFLSSNSSAFDHILTASVTLYDDKSRPYGHMEGDKKATISGYANTDYDPEIYVNAIPATGKKHYNPFVLGHEGNYRPSAQYMYVAPRNYTGNVKNDGKYSIKADPFWNNVNNNGKVKILSENLVNRYKWRAINQFVYDVFGNAVNEKDASGKNTSAQYGYNRSLPVAVTSNADAQSSCFEGFEDYTMLIPKHLHNQYKETYYNHSFFAKMFNNVNPGDLLVNNYGQQYYKKLNLSEDGDVITSTYSHTGKYSLRLQNMKSFQIPIADSSGHSAYGGLGDFGIQKPRSYLVSLWVRPDVAGQQVPIAGAMSYKLVINCPAPSVLSDTYPFTVKSGNIDGWYLVTGVIQTRTDLCSLYLTLPETACYDDIRIVPVDAHMKSFVYDPLSFKLIAELDENNFATFYEYDQEGLLIRVKKETEKGIMTISENRRSNAKNQ